MNKNISKDLLESLSIEEITNLNLEINELFDNWKNSINVCKSLLEE